MRKGNFVLTLVLVLALVGGAAAFDGDVHADGWTFDFWSLTWGTWNYDLYDYGNGHGFEQTCYQSGWAAPQNAYCDVNVW